MIGLWSDSGKQAYHCRICQSGPYQWPTPKCSKCSGEDRIVRKVEIRQKREVKSIDHSNYEMEVKGEADNTLNKG
jgi:hypothetical protein